jgi:Zn-dependent protease with chaperone function
MSVPVDRKSFFEFEARNRAATWRLSAVCGLVIFAAGAVTTVGFIVNLVLVLFALIFLPAVILLGVGFLVGRIPAIGALREPIFGVAMFVLHGLTLVTRLWPSDHPIFLLGAAIVLPLVCWICVRYVFIAAGVGRILLSMTAREPKAGDLEENQLVNVAGEMAIAAGIPQPRLLLLDGGIANAATVGIRPEDSYVVIGRRLLDEFDRDETQGILGHLVGSIANGDLRGAAQIHAMLYVLELLTVVVLAPFASLPRRIAIRWLTFPLTGSLRSTQSRTDQAGALIDLLESHREVMPSNEAGMTDTSSGTDYFGRVGRVLVRIAPPLMALIFLSKAATGFMLVFASAPVGLLWRSRKYLADATGVQLTRNPDGLYRALVQMSKDSVIVPGAGAISHLFVVAPEGTGQKDASFSDREGLLMGMYPSVNHRLARLKRMGAAPTA